MFTVECPGCKAAYQIDERRVAATGLKMRCPKCSTAFVVEKPESSTAGVQPGAGTVPTDVGLGLRSEVKGPPQPPLQPPNRIHSPHQPPTRGNLPGPPPPAAPPTAGAIANDATARTTPVQAVPAKAPGEGRAKPPIPRRSAAATDEDLLPRATPERIQAQIDPLPHLPASPALPDTIPPNAAVPAPDEIDLPAPAKSPSRAERSRVDQAARDQFKATDPDLPSVRIFDDLPATLESDLPAALSAPRGTSQQRARQPHGDALPARPASPADRDLDLPGIVGAANAASNLDRSRDKSHHEQPSLDLDLPSPLAAQRKATDVSTKSLPPELDDFEFDLPSPAQARQFESPSPTQAQQGVAQDASSGGHRRGTVPGGFDPPSSAADLPAPAYGAIGLPSVPGRPDPSKRTLAGSGPGIAERTAEPLPGRGTGAPMELDLGLDFDAPIDQGNRSAAPAAAARTDPSLPPALGNRPQGVTDSSSRGQSFDLELPAVSGAAMPERVIPPLGSAVRGENRLGGVDFGEVSLESSSSEFAVETELNVERRSLSAEALEFGTMPQTEARAEQAPAIDTKSDIGVQSSSAHAATKARTPIPAKQSDRATTRRSRLVALAVVATAVIGGSALSLQPDIGPFGAHFIIDQIRRKDNAELVRRHIEAGRQVLVLDDYSGLAKVSSALTTACREHERLIALKTYAAYFIYATELRHGSQPQVRAQAKVLLDELGDRAKVTYFGLAVAARAAAEGNLAKARRMIVDEIARDARNVEAQILSAEVSLLEHRSADALQSWQLAARLEKSARTAFGVARTLAALGQFDAAKSAAEQTLELNPKHVGARLLLARVAMVKAEDFATAERLIAEAVALESHQSTADFVLAKILTGDLHLMRSRITLAEAAYQEALSKDPRAAAALRGLGEALYRAGRYSESLARYEAGIQADPDDVQVAVGAARAQLALERVRDAVTLLGRLRQANPKHYAVNYWYGRAEDAAGNREEAERAYAVAIDVGGTDPAVVDAYVSMAMLKNQQGRREEAQKVLAAAQEKLPRMPKIHDAIGQLALSEGRYANAIDEFKQALALDPNDLGIKFRLGGALRRNRDFESAAKVFDEVSAVDRDYPGLALERGQLFESSGQPDEALRAFESALAKAPTDPDLMLRVGCGKVAAGRSQQAELLLKKVLDQRPTSAETHHCLGRAQLFDGSNLALALRTLERAVELDPHRAEYYLYVGWAANEAGRVPTAEQALKKALELDQGLGDAYWQRGILRYRQGAVKDAVADLTRALELRPGRYEAHAALADAYFDLGLEQKALEQWRLATVAQPDNATWRYRYGKLLQAAHRDGDARAELAAALELAAKLPVTPRWAWEAHHLLARAIGMHPTAVNHWQKFLELAPRDNVYRDEAKQALSKLGTPWDKD